MLDHDPNADQPPDPSLSRARPRSHKPKNAPKKQPQRGLGVAQLEKLRLEEQSKQQEAICLASLQHQTLHHRGRVHQQEQYSSHFLHQHHHPFQHQNLDQSSSLCLSRQIKLVEPPLDKSSFPLPFVKLNATQNGLLPLTVMANRRQTPSLPLLIPQQQLGNEDEASLSPLSNVPDLCSPGYVRPSSAESRLCPQLVRTPPAARGENPWLSHLYDRDSTKEKDSTITFLSSASCSDSDTRLQSFDHGMTDSTNAAISSFHGNLHISMEKPYMQGEGIMTPFTELCLSGHPHSVGAFDLHNPSRTHLEPPPVSIASGGVQTRELSSFQTVPLCPNWSPLDKVCNRKRSWACTQELARQSESFKGVDLNVSVDEMEAKVAERDSNISLPFTFRDVFDCSPALSPKKMSSQNTIKALLADKACSECGSMKVGNAISDLCINGSAFLSLRKKSLDHEKWEVETSGEFLTLGPSCSSLQMMRSEQRRMGNYSTCTPMRKPGENANFWPSQMGCGEQAKGAQFFADSRAAANDDIMGLLDYKPGHHNTSLQRNDFVALSKMEGYSSCHRENNIDDEPLDLELRLSI